MEVRGAIDNCNFMLIFNISVNYYTSHHIVLLNFVLVIVQVIPGGIGKVLMQVFFLNFLRWFLGKEVTHDTW